jgi:NADPH:quinone reductase-like Zn-dependent oxidoreductase
MALSQEGEHQERTEGPDRRRGGTIGTVAVQLTMSFGAEVTAVDSANKLEMLRSIGADKVVDYTKDDFTESGETYDVIFDVVGKSSFSGCLRSLNGDRFYLLGNPGLSQQVRRVWASATTSKVVGARCHIAPKRWSS